LDVDAENLSWDFYLGDKPITEPEPFQYLLPDAPVGYQYVITLQKINENTNQKQSWQKKKKKNQSEAAGAEQSENQSPS